MSADLNLRTPSAVLGLTTGLLLGFSTSPVVGGAISSLLTGAFLLMSLAPEASKISLQKVHISAISFFAIFLLLGAGAGLYFKSQSLLFPSPIQIDFQHLSQIGVSENDARSAVLAKYTDGGNFEPTTGLKGSSSFNASIVSKISNSNATILHALEAMDKTAETQLIEANVKTIAFSLRDLMEESIGQEAAILWHKFYVAKASDKNQIWINLQRNYPDEHSKIESFFSGNN